MSQNINELLAFLYWNLKYTLQTKPICAKLKKNCGCHSISPTFYHYFPMPERSVGKSQWEKTPDFFKAFLTTIFISSLNYEILQELLRFPINLHLLRGVSSRQFPSAFWQTKKGFPWFIRNSYSKFLACPVVIKHISIVSFTFVIYFCTPHSHNYRKYWFFIIYTPTF